MFLQHIPLNPFYYFQNKREYYTLLIFQYYNNNNSNKEISSVKWNRPGHTL